LAGHDIVVIGASSGGVEALRNLIGGLPEDLPAAVFVVVHFPEGAPSVLPHILNRAGPLKAGHPDDGEPIKKGRIYVALPDFHLLMERGRVCLGHGPKENRHRPAADSLFRSAAVAYGPRVVGVVLTGAQDDGSAGLRAIKRRGGVAVVQDPEDALFPGMPESALRYVAVDHCLPLDEIPPLLDRITRQEAKEEGAYPVPDDIEIESKIAGLDPTAIASDDRPGELSAFSCPECSGPLYEIQDGQLVRFRCRVGHAYTADGMLDGKTEALENALYVAFNTLEESAAMAERLAARSREQQNDHAARRFEERARDSRRRAAVIRHVLTEGATDVPADAL
jgi:two-component system chemotaxis response regulator CheB